MKERGTGKINCWEAKHCGREERGINADTLGVCPAAVSGRHHGLHGGINGGRACWMIAGTMCEGEVQGTFARKYKDCALCDFYLLVAEEEGLQLYCELVSRPG